MPELLLLDELLEAAVPLDDAVVPLDDAVVPLDDAVVPLDDAVVPLDDAVAGPSPHAVQTVSASAPVSALHPAPTPSAATDAALTQTRTLMQRD